MWVNGTTGELNKYFERCPSYLLGWFCPKCGRVYSPKTIECWACNSGINTKPTVTWRYEYDFISDTVSKGGGISE